MMVDQEESSRDTSSRQDKDPESLVPALGESISQPPEEPLWKNDDGYEREREIQDLQKLRYSLSPNIYSMIFLAKTNSSAFLYCFLTFALKICLYVFLTIELSNEGFAYNPKDRLVIVAQCLSLPIAVALQEDLIESYALIANIRYEPVAEFPSATKSKWVLAFVCRMLDGFASLAVNYVLLMQATDVLTLMLNFAALQFLQSIDDTAYSMGKEGYLTICIEHLFNGASNVTMPRKKNRCVHILDSILFVLTTSILFAGWVVVLVRNADTL